MKKVVLGLVLVGVAAVSGCDMVAPPAENAAVPQPAAAQASKDAVAFVPKLIDLPVVGVYTPSFEYSLRNRGDANAENGGKNFIALEFWGVSVENAHQDVKAKMIASGFKLVSEDSANGAWVNHYANDKFADVLVNVAPMGARSKTTPEGVGTVYFEWKN